MVFSGGVVDCSAEDLEDTAVLVLVPEVDEAGVHLLGVLPDEVGNFSVAEILKVL